MRRRVAIIGGGISGLAAAHHIREKNPELDVLLLEAGKRLGGVIQTSKQAGFLIESAADNFITTTSSATSLCQRLGLSDDLIETNPIGRKAMVVRKGKLRPIPAGFLVMAPSRLWPLMSTRVLSAMGKVRAGCELLIPRRKTDVDESLKSFVCRRFGREMFDRLVQPLVGGIYTADPNQLSVAATMPRFQQMEREHGSLIRAMLRQRRGKPQEKSSGARYGQFVTLRGGMSRMIETLASRLPWKSIRLDSPVSDIVPTACEGWSVFVGGDHPSCEEVDGVVLAAPAHHSSRLLEIVDPPMADALGKIEYASCAVVSLAYRREQINHPLDAFGFVVPLVENRLILSCSFSSLKYDGRAPDGTVLLRVFIGGACQDNLLRLPDEQLVELAKREIESLLKINGRPLLEHFTRQSHSMPQYHVGHCERIATIEQRLQRFPTLALAGSSLHGVGVPACIESGESAAERIVSSLAVPSRLRMQPIQVKPF